MKSRRPIGLVLGLAMSLVLTACGQPAAKSDSQPQPAPQNTQAAAPAPAPAPAGDGSLARIKEAGVLRVGSTPTGAPFTFLNPETTQIEGIMVDLAQSVGERLGVKVEIVNTPFASLIPSLEANKIDIISAGMYITPERQKVVNFTEPLFGWGEALVVPISDTTSQSMDDFQGKRVAAQTGTAYIKTWESKGHTEVKVYKSVADMLTEIANGRIDAFVADGPIVGFNILRNPQFKDKVRVVAGYKPVAYGETGFGFRPADKELHAAVSEIAAELKAEGTVREITAKWGLNTP